MEYTGKRTRLFHKGKAVSFIQCTKEQMQRYPEYKIQDLVKLAYQSAYGPAHGVPDRKQAWKQFSGEYASQPAILFPFR